MHAKVKLKNLSEHINCNSLVVSWSVMQFEREREEHLRPRLQLVEPPERSTSEVSDRTLNTNKEESESESEKEEQAKPKIVPAPPVKVLEAAISQNSQHSASEANTPFTDDEASRQSAPGQFDEESLSQASFGPQPKEQFKMGFSGLKLGACPILYRRAGLSSFIQDDIVSIVGEHL
jgi:hypothetical protein